MAGFADPEQSTCVRQTFVTEVRVNRGLLETDGRAAVGGFRVAGGGRALMATSRWVEKGMPVVRW